MNRRLYRCHHDRRIAGVASGIAEYFDADPTVVRVLWVLSIFFGGVGLLLYVAMALIVPIEPEDRGATPGGTGEFTGDVAGDVSGGAAIPSPTGWQTPPAHRHISRGTGRGMTFFGYILILFGSLALVEALLPAWSDGGRFLWPAFIVGIGALLVFRAIKREPTES